MHPAPVFARSIAARRPRAAAAAVKILPLVGLAFATLESAVVYAAGQLLRAIGAY